MTAKGVCLMLFRKTFLLLIVLLASCCLCYAQPSNNLDNTIAKNELSLGGVTINMPYQNVVQMYGVPQWQYGDPGNGIAIYGDSVRIGFDNNVVTYVLVMADNGWKTPKGISVGMTIDDVHKAYGNTYAWEKGAKGDYLVYRYTEGPERRGNTIFMEKISLYVSHNLSPKINALEIYSHSPNKATPGLPEHYK